MHKVILLIKKKVNVAKKLLRQQRVNYIVPADYTEESRAYQLVCAIIDKIKADRLETKSSRDEAARKMHDDLIRMQCKHTEFESNLKILFEQSIKNSNDISELSRQHAEVMVTLRNILDTLKEIKDK